MTDDQTVSPDAGNSPEPGEAAQPATAPDPIQQLTLQLEEAQKAAEAFKDQLLRKAADFENYKKRTEADIASIIRNANDSLILSLLPVIDDLNRSLKHGGESSDHDSFYRGVELIRSKLTKILEARGLVPFESVGKPFDVSFHDALLAVPRKDLPHHTVVEEVARGYMLNDKVLRHAKVIVSSQEGAKPEEAPDTEGEADG
jgi:molecular chaperone GrpE